MIRQMNERIVNIINPAAGQGKVPSRFDGEIYTTKCRGDAEEYVEGLCRDAEQPLFLRVFGGDGTLGEVVTGIMRSGRNDNVRLSAVPTGTGNDFVRAFEGKSGEHRIDVMKVGDRYAVNVANTGFDCRVVVKAGELKKKPLISGSMAYVLGVVQTLLGKLGEDMRVEYTDENGETNIIEDKLLLVVCANAPYHGGGFKAAPLADYSDGLLEMLIVPKVSRLQFISLVADYRSGRHLDPDTGAPIERFKDIVTYRRIKSIKVTGLELACADGEVRDADSMEISVIPGALRVVF